MKTLSPPAFRIFWMVSALSVSPRRSFETYFSRSSSKVEQCGPPPAAVK
jgi:hypothetical protein